MCIAASNGAAMRNRRMSCITHKANHGQIAKTNLHHNPALKNSHYYESFLFDAISFLIFGMELMWRETGGINSVVISLLVM